MAFDILYHMDKQEENRLGPVRRQCSASQLQYINTSESKKEQRDSKPESEVHNSNTQLQKYLNKIGVQSLALITIYIFRQLCTFTCRSHRLLSWMYQET